MRFLLPLIGLMLLSACTVRTAHDYDQYLRNNTGSVSYPAVRADACYALTERTLTHKEHVTSWLSGITNVWTVQIGPMLQSTMNSADVRKAFPALREMRRNEACSWTITYDLLYYDFVDTRAKLNLAATMTSPDGRSMTKSYYAEGQGQLGKMYWSKGFGMKNAVQQSTKHAIDAILTEQFRDMANFVAQHYARIEKNPVSSMWTARTTNPAPDKVL